MMKWLRTAVVLLACAAILGVLPGRQAGPVAPSGAAGVVHANRATAGPGNGPGNTTVRGRARVVALAGDSIASGEGGGSYAAGTDRPHDRCHQSAKAMGAGLVAAAAVRNVACSRAVINDFYASPHADDWTEHPPVAQLQQLRMAAPDVTIIVVGANDIGFAAMLDGCLLGEADCSTDVSLVGRTRVLTEELGARLERLYADVLLAVAGDVWVPAYPDLLSGTEDCGRLTAAEMAYGRSVIAALNQQIDVAVRRRVGGTNSDAGRLMFVPETATALAGHGPCSDSPWVHSTGAASLLDAAAMPSHAQEILHPTALGYEALTQSLSHYYGSE